jgi:hypothetical protein
MLKGRSRVKVELRMDGEGVKLSAEGCRIQAAAAEVETTGESVAEEWGVHEVWSMTEREEDPLEW